MGNKLYINGIAGISAQAGEDIISGKIAEVHQNIFPAQDENYKEFIPPMMLRRMSKAVKMAITAGRKSLADAGVEEPDAIITGTGEGCKQDTGKFLKSMLQQEEGLLTPTSFIQSTHNTVGGQIALNLKCTAYNVTYTQACASLESALLDARLQFSEDPELKSVLVGGVDEIDENITPFYYLDGQLKMEQISNLELFNSNSPGSIASEGAHFFTISAESNNNSYARLEELSIFNSASEEEVEKRIEEFLNQNNISSAEVDVVVLGKNGDAKFDHYYTRLQEGVFSETLQLAYKHLVGEYNTASGYAIWLASEIFRRNEIPKIFRLNEEVIQAPEKILLYNQYQGRNHSLILLSRP